MVNINLTDTSGLILTMAQSHMCWPPISNSNTTFDMLPPYFRPWYAQLHLLHIIQNSWRPPHGLSHSVFNSTFYPKCCNDTCFSYFYNSQRHSSQWRCHPECSPVTSISQAASCWYHPSSSGSSLWYRHPQRDQSQPLWLLHRHQSYVMWYNGYMYSSPNRDQILQINS